MLTTYLATIPFAGFYGAAHDAEFDRVLEYLFKHYADEAQENMPQWLYDELTGAPDYAAAYELYAEEYAHSFLNWLGLDGKFESMSSPREYNFTTDRVFVELTRGDIARLWRGVDKARFAALCRKRFTSRDGFISHYSADWRTWGRIGTWDHNQLGTLVQAYAETEIRAKWDLMYEVELMEDVLCDGALENWLFDTSERFCRAWRVAEYMIERARRPVRTLDQWHAARRAENRPFADTPLGAWSVV